MFANKVIDLKTELEIVLFSVITEKKFIVSFLLS